MTKAKNNLFMNLSILILDDSLMDMRILNRILISADDSSHVISFDNPLIALAYFEDIINKNESLKLPDLIFLDINMPDMNGFEFLDALSKYGDVIKSKIVITSSSDDTQDIEKSADYKNVIGYLIKPVQKEDLMQIESILEKVIKN